MKIYNNNYTLLTDKFNTVTEYVRATESIWKVDLRRQSLRHIDFSGKNVTYSNLSQSDNWKISGENCKISLCDFSQSDIYRPEFVNCNFFANKFTGADITNGIFEDCNFGSCDFSRCNLFGTMFINCDLSDVCLHYAEIGGVTLDNCIIKGIEVDNIPTIRNLFTKILCGRIKNEARGSPPSTIVEYINDVLQEQPAIIDSMDCTNESFINMIINKSCPYLDGVQVDYYNESATINNAFIYRCAERENEFGD